MSVFTKAKGIAAAAFATATVIAATPAFAGAPASALAFESNGRTMEVRYADLDLTQADGRAELRSRLSRAASRVCYTSDSREMRACRINALDHIKEPVKTVIARAETRSRYADATPTKVMVGN